MRQLATRRYQAAGAGLAFLAVACGADEPESASITAPLDPFEGGTYQLVALHSDRCVAVAGASGANGANARQEFCTTAAEQKWTLLARPDGSYRLSAEHSGKCLVALGKPAEVGDNVQQGRCIYQRSKWLLNEVAEGVVTLESVKTGLCAEVALASTNEGANLQQGACTDAEHQQFRLLSAADCPEGNPRQCGAVAEHNAIRAAAPSAAPPLGDMVWDADLAALAQSWANTCPTTHNPDRLVRGQTAGENIYLTSAPSPRPPADVIQYWAAEGSTYDITTNYCAGAVHNGLNNFNCGHYTQLVWRETTLVGCGMVTGCADTFSQIWVCNYLDAGNLMTAPSYDIRRPY